MMKIVEINDIDKNEKITYFVLHIDEKDIVKVTKLIELTWKTKDYDVALLKKNLIDGFNPDKIDFIYDCTLDTQNLVELSF